MRGCSNESKLVINDYSEGNGALPIINTSVIMAVPQLHNGDAKFYNDRIITHVNGILTCIDFSGNIVQYNDTYVHWIDAIDKEGIIIYGNWNNEIGCIRLDEDYNLIANNVIIKSDNLMIDPTITKVNNEYYITFTEIIGTINNADVNVENGEYIARFYKSHDLQNWSYVSDIIDVRHNVEDVDFFQNYNDIYVVYELEEIDKGKSSVMVKKSSDQGVTWGEPVELLSCDSDHEPASIKMVDDKYYLYYSCDKDNIGMSYMGAKAYYAVYDQSFCCIEKDCDIITETKQGILLYDVTEINDKNYFLFAADYLTTCDMVLEIEY